jgi:hypothetical protein
MTRDRRIATITFEDRTLKVEVGEFQAIITSARCQLFETAKQLKATPLDWDSSLVRKQFENLLEHIRTTEEQNDTAAWIIDLLMETGHYAPNAVQEESATQ